jgi:hypothetical protein
MEREKLSEERILSLHTDLAHKLIEHAKLQKQKNNLIKTIKLENEILETRREINKELDIIKGPQKKIDFQIVEQ